MARRRPMVPSRDDPGCRPAHRDRRRSCNPNKLYQRGIGMLSFKKRRIELMTQGDLVTMARDGALELRPMQSAGLSRERVLAALREQGSFTWER
jgi:hypothetical protein